MKKLLLFTAQQQVSCSALAQVLAAQGVLDENFVRLYWQQMLLVGGVGGYMKTYLWGR